MLRKRINELRRLAQPLEPEAKVRRELLKRIIQYSEDFLENIYKLPAFVLTENNGKGIDRCPIAETPIPIDGVLQLLDQHVNRPGLNPASGAHLGYIPGGGIYYSALGDYLADVFNRYAGVFFAGPGAVSMENMLLRWMANLVGYPENSAGNLTSGGSIANLIGIVTAREAFDLQPEDIEKTVVYLTEQAHHSVHKALRIAGLKRCIMRYVSMDSRYRMQARSLEQAVVQDKKDGLIPWLIVASAGTTDTGAIDPIKDIARIAKKHNLWFHLDGAYGAFFILCDEGKKLLQGIEDSDSLVMDPHKGLFLPYGSGAILVKDGQKLLEAHYYMPNYLQDTLASREELSPADLSPELTRPFRGLRLWIALKLIGVAPFRAALEEKLWLARYFYEKIQEIGGFEVGPYPDLSVVTFRYVPPRGDANEFNRRLIQEIHRDGRVFISSTMLDSKFTLRVAILAFRTHLETIDLALEILKEKAENIARNF